MDVICLPVEKWEQYRELRLRALREDPDAFSTSYADSLNQPEQSWESRLVEAAVGERTWLLFARQDDGLVGMIGAFVEKDAADTATIVSVYVPREARRQGISGHLMEEMLHRLSQVPELKKARLRVNVTQHPAILLYRRFGFREIGREPSTTGAGTPVQQLVMERELPFHEPGQTPA